MTIHQEVPTFLKQAFTTNAWKPAVLELGKLRAPDCVLGAYSSLLWGDVSRCWAKWFSEGFFSPHHITRSNLTYADVRVHIHQELTKQYPNITQELNDVVDIVSKRLFTTAKQIQENRKEWSKAIKRYLIDSYAEQPYCKICGHRFQEGIRDAFANQRPMIIPSLPKFIDVYKPRGLFKEDFQIQIDHIVPISQDGSNDKENLQLLCGWCNRHKSNLESMYDVPQIPQSTRYKGRQYNLPHEFWIVRILSLFQRPTYLTEEHATVETHELTIFPKSTLGVLNPTNLAIVAYGKDDPLKDSRFIPYEEAANLWGKKTKRYPLA